MKTVIKRFKIRSLWHFTDKSNIKSIKASEGLLSLRELEQQDISILMPGGNDWRHDADRGKGLDEYVHLAFFNDHPMLFKARNEGRIPNPIWIKIDPSIMLEDGVRFSSDVSNKSGVEILDADEALEQIDFEVLFTRMDWNNKKINRRRQAAYKSEILVPKFVPISQFLGYENG